MGLIFGHVVQQERLIRMHEVVIDGRFHSGDRGEDRPHDTGEMGVVALVVLTHACTVMGFLCLLVG